MGLALWVRVYIKRTLKGTFVRCFYKWLQLCFGTQTAKSNACNGGSLSGSGSSAPSFNLGVAAWKVQLGVTAAMGVWERVQFPGCFFGESPGTGLVWKCPKTIPITHPLKALYASGTCEGICI